MICGLRGQIHDFGPSSVELETNGVIYEVHVPLPVLSHLQAHPATDEIYLYIYHHITEATQKLYGFLGRVEREFFVALLGVKGIGGSLALSILSHIELPRLLELSEAKDEKSLTHIPRVGKAIAATLLLEIELKRKKWEALLGREEEVHGVPSAQTSKPQDRELELALQGLVQLGYKEREAGKALQKARELAKGSAEKTAADWVTECLKLL